MKFNSKILIFTDLDGSLLNRDNFEFGSIKNFIKELLSHDIFIIPNSSKTAKEITNFNDELEEKLPYIAENGSSIHDLNLINSNFPEKITLSREISELLENKGPDVTFETTGIASIMEKEIAVAKYIVQAKWHTKHEGSGYNGRRLEKVLDKYPESALLNRLAEEVPVQNLHNMGYKDDPAVKALAP